METKSFSCKWAGQCSGCPWIGDPYENQIQQKRRHLLNALAQHSVDINAEIPIHKIDLGGLRDRVDLTLADGKIGLYRQSDRFLLDIDLCPQMSPGLSEWYQEFRQNLPDIQRGSIRLRVAPDGRRGAWLDFANVDIKRLLEEGTWLRHLQQKATVEIGQRRKRLIEKDGQLKLGSPESYPWFQTFLGEEEKPKALFCSIGSFTQPGFLANRQLVRTVRETLASLPRGRWLELFCGIGNFTLPLISWGFTPTAIEVDVGSLVSLKQSLEDLGWQDRVTTVKKDLYSKSIESELLNFEGWLVDPPRSGLGRVREVLAQIPLAKRPNFITYISCYTESFAEDLGVLQNLGYRIAKISGVDQFPQSAHCEWVALLITPNHN